MASMFGILSYALMAVAIGLGFWRGGAPERWIAAIILAMMLFDRAGHQIIGSDEARLRWLHVALDASALLAMGGVTLFARRWWTLCALACQLLSLLADISGIADRNLPGFAVVTVSAALNYPIQLALLWGTIGHRRRLRRNARDPPWRSSSR